MHHSGLPKETKRQRGQVLRYVPYRIQPKKERTMRVAKSLSIIIAIAFLALAVQIFVPAPVLAANAINLSGHFISAEYGYDTSTVGTAGATPVIFATAATMVFNPSSKTKGDVCGEADGFYPGISAPGTNLGPTLFHGTYTYDSTTSRIIIYQCGDGAPAAGNVFCGTFTACGATEADSGTATMSVGYVQNGAGSTKIQTVNQVTTGNPTSTGFLVHKHEWTKVGD